MFFSDKQKNKVEFYALVYVISFLLPFPASLYSVALSQLGGVVLWLIGSITYMIVYLRVASELPKEDRYFVIWGQASYFPQVLFKVAPLLIFVLLCLLGSL
ncbi:hypothetical protein I6F65_21380 [Pseudoalteromonas sp. SWXJZ94C]|uniref:hypothetical protein n=1 Tax=Pseudoalteromonas sp. SWXJZ94C TaxID=2792065 RepID=UPI0018CFC33E|nr:hypothetical protein [Pseudoalteromonas sp. SWXJZ94C]MBH0059486.1 hypothetical protein [Pseudoalteromonas sp. SWXJZ94C]